MKWIKMIFAVILSLIIGVAEIPMTALATEKNEEKLVTLDGSNSEAVITGFEGLNSSQQNFIFRKIINQH